MIFPFAISSKITLDQKDYGITSEKYVLNKITDHVDNFGLCKQRISDNEVFYMKVNIFQLLRRQDFLRNLSIRVDCSDDSIQISLTTNTVLMLCIALAAIIFPFFMTSYQISLHIFLFVIAAAIPYTVRAVVLSITKSELIQVMQAFKKKSD